jgi:hypothetical protein
MAAFNSALRSGAIRSLSARVAQRKSLTSRHTFSDWLGHAMMALGEKSSFLCLRQ